MKPTLSSLFPLPESICRCETYKRLRRYSLTQYNPSVRHKAFWAQRILNAHRNGFDNAADIHGQFSWRKRASNQPPFARCILKGPAREPGRKREMSTIANGTLQLLHTRKVYVCISCFQYWHFKTLGLMFRMFEAEPKHDNTVIWLDIWHQVYVGTLFIK